MFFVFVKTQNYRQVENKAFPNSCLYKLLFLIFSSRINSWNIAVQYWFTLYTELKSVNVTLSLKTELKPVHCRWWFSHRNILLLIIKCLLWKFTSFICLMIKFSKYIVHSKSLSINRSFGNSLELCNDTLWGYNGSITQFCQLKELLI